MLKKLVNKTLFTFFTLAVFAVQNGQASDLDGSNNPRSHLYIVGSSTVSPLMTAVSEEFSRHLSTKNFAIKTPLVETTGTSTGFKIFCEGVGYQHPDFVNASRPITKSDVENCNHNDVTGIVEIKIGYDGIVLATFFNSKKFTLTKEQIFLALADKVPNKNGEGLVVNPYETWNQINPKLPNTPILIYGPPLTSGTRDVFVEMVMKDTCFTKKELSERYKNKETHEVHCPLIRSDGKFVEAGENDDVIVQKIKADHHAFGIFGFNFLIKNASVIKAIPIDNVKPSFDSIASKRYELSRPLFVYFKKEHLLFAPQMREFIQEIINPETIGANGYLTHSGLVAMPEKELDQVRKNVLSQLQIN